MIDISPLPALLRKTKKISGRLTVNNTVGDQNVRHAVGRKRQYQSDSDQSGSGYRNFPVGEGTYEGTNEET